MSSHSPARVELRPAPGGGAVLALSGSLDVATASGARTEIQACLAGGVRSSLEVDVSGIDGRDMSGLAVLEELRRGRFTSGSPVPVKGLPPRFALLLRSFPTAEAVAAATSEEKSCLGEIMGEFEADLQTALASRP